MPPLRAGEHPCVAGLDPPGVCPHHHRHPGPRLAGLFSLSEQAFGGTDAHLELTPNRQHSRKCSKTAANKTALSVAQVRERLPARVSAPRPQSARNAGALAYAPYGGPPEYEVRQRARSMRSHRPARGRGRRGGRREWPGRAGHREATRGRRMPLLGMHPLQGHDARRQRPGRDSEGRAANRQVGGQT